MRRPASYKEYRTLASEVKAADLAHYFNNELVSLTSIGEVAKLSIENSSLDENQKQDLTNQLDRVMASLTTLHEIANDAFLLIQKKE